MSALVVHTAMRSAFRQVLIDLEGIPAAKAWEARKFSPVKGTPFVRESFRPVTSRPRAVGTGGTIAHRMLGIATLFYPAGIGTKEIEEAAGVLLDAFEPGRSLVYGLQSGVVQQAERAGLITDPDWVSCPVTVTIMAYTAK